MSPMIEDSIDRSQSNSSDRLEVCEPRVSGRVKPMATSEVTDAEDGTAIDADVGDTILLAVLDDPTTGYRWEARARDRRIHRAGRSGIRDVQRRGGQWRRGYRP